MGFAKWLAGRFGGGREQGGQVNHPQYNLIFNVSSNAMAFTGPDGGRIIDVNEAWVRATGISRDQCIGKTALELGIWVNLSERKTCYALLEAKGRLVEHEVKLLTKGEERIFLASARFVKTPEGRHILWEFRDVTEAIEAEKELLKSEKEWRETFDAAGDAIMLLDAYQKIIRVNRASKKLLKAEESGVIGGYCYKLIHKMDAPPDFCPVSKAKLTKKREEAEIRLPDGKTWLWVSADPVLDDNGEITGFVHIVRDITERKLTEEKIHFLAAAVEQSTEGVAIIDMSGKVVFSNEAFVRMHGYQISEVLGKDVSVFHSPEQMPSVAAANREIKETGSFSGEVWHTRKDGTKFPAWMHNTLLRDEKGEPRGIIGTLRDVSKNKLMETLLEESAERFRGIYEQSPLGIGLFDAEGKIVDFNPACLRMLGIRERGEVKSWSIFDLMTLFGKGKEGFAAGRPVRFEMAIDFERIREAGLYMPTLSGMMEVDISVSPLRLGKYMAEGGYLVQMQDITERKRSSRDRDNFFNFSMDMMCIAGFDRYFKEVNPAWTSTLGWTAAELTSKPWMEFVHPDDKNATERARETLVDGRSLFMFENRCLAKDGSYRWLSWNSFPLKQEGRIFAVVRDVTERKKAEEKLKQSELKYKNIIKTTQDGFWYVDEEGHFLDVNDAACRMLGYERDDLLKKKIADIEKMEDEAGVILHIAKMRDAGGDRFETMHRRKDGSLVDVEVITSFVADAGGAERLFVFVRDITERKRTENEMKKLASIVQHSTELVNIAMPDGKMIFLNEAGSQMLGITPLEAHEHNIMQVIPEDFKETVQKELLPVLARGENWNGELRYKNLRTGKTTDTYATCFPIKDQETGEILYFANTSLDITERKKAEAAIRESESRFRELFNNSNVGVCVYAAANGGEDFIFKEFNPAAERFENIKKEDVIGRSVLEVFPAVKEFGIFDVFKRVWKTGKPEKMPTKMYKDKRIEGWRENYICRLPSGEVVTIYDDVTEQKKSEERIKALARFPQENPNPVMRVDCHGEILHANPPANKLLLAWGAPAGKAPESFVADMIETCKTGQPSQKEVKINDRIYLFVTSPVPEEKFANIYAIDITKRKKTAQELESYRAHLEDLVKERTAELESFSYSISHDLRAPLRAIDGFVRILLDEYGSKFDDEGRRITDVIVENTRNMGRLIDDLLAFSRLGRKEPEISDIDMTASARKIGEEIISSEAGRQIEFNGGDLPASYGDRAMIELALTNLLSNAVKFTRKNKKASIEVTGKEEGREKVYCVKDNGVGFDMRYVDKLFGVFQRLHSAEEFEGTGIGLALVKRIVAKHGGRVWAEGEVGKGAAFYFSLPKRDA